MALAEAAETIPATVRQQAEHLAADNREIYPELQRILWFPHPEEVRIVEVLPDSVPSPDHVVAFHFGAWPERSLPHRSAVAQVRPEEVCTAKLPNGWGTWDDAEDLP
jgi:hypothetical protein